MIETDKVRSVLIPLQGAQLLLPNASVAEVVHYVAPEALPDSPDWLLGQMSWREQSVPLVSFERLMGQSMDEQTSRQTRVAICYTLNGNTQRPYIAILAASRPRLVQVLDNNISPETEVRELGAEVLRQVKVDGERALIPDLDELEERVKLVLGGGS
jgi:chemosensory pili system protein ChpC